MKSALTFVLIVGLAGTAAAVELGNRAPIKPDVYPDYVNPPERQGGDTIETATVISTFPYETTGTTCGYTNDYDEVCPYSLSTSPDVVYSYACSYDQLVDIDLCGSLYDTKLYVYDEDLNLIACNDDYYFDDVCGVYVSALWSVSLSEGVQYFIVVDGYGGDCGDYELYVDSIVGICYTGCPPGSVLEGEPELTDGYLDAYNGGCNSPDFGTPFQMLEANQPGGTLSFCGKSGWYDDGFRDTDWFTVVLDPEGPGVLECSLCGELPTYLFELGPQNCDQVGVLQQVQSTYMWADMTVVAEPGAVVWLWVGPVTFYPPPGYGEHEYDYILELEGLQGSVALDASTWSRVKGLYR